MREVTDDAAIWLGRLAVASHWNREDIGGDSDCFRVLHELLQEFNERNEFT